MAPLMCATSALIQKVAVVGQEGLQDTTGLDGSGAGQVTAGGGARAGLKRQRFIFIQR